MQLLKVYHLRTLSFLFFIFFSLDSNSEQIPSIPVPDSTIYTYSTSNGKFFSEPQKAVDSLLETGSLCAASPQTYSNCEVIAYDFSDSTLTYSYLVNGTPDQGNLNGLLYTIVGIAYICPATHPIEIDANNNGVPELCETDNQQCEIPEGTQGQYEQPYNGTVSESSCINSCSMNYDAVLDAANWQQNSCYTKPNSSDPTQTYCTGFLVSTGQTCTGQDGSDPTIDPTTPIPSTNNDGVSTQAPDLYVDPATANCSQTSSGRLCQVPINDACSVSGTCNSSCAGHNGVVAFCFVDTTGHPSGLPNGTSTTTTTEISTTTTVENPDGSTTDTTETITVDVTDPPGGSGSGDGIGDVECPPSGCQQDLYEANDWSTRNFGTVIDAFQTRMSNSEIGSTVGTFFNVTASAGCPVWSYNIEYINVAGTVDFLCSSTGAYILSVFGSLMLLIATYHAFMWAIVRS